MGHGLTVMHATVPIAAIQIRQTWRPDLKLM